MMSLQSIRKTFQWWYLNQFNAWFSTKPSNPTSWITLWCITIWGWNNFSWPSCMATHRSSTWIAPNQLTDTKRRWTCTHIWRSDRCWIGTACCLRYRRWFYEFFFLSGCLNIFFWVYFLTIFRGVRLIFISNVQWLRDLYVFFLLNECASQCKWSQM